MKIRKIAFAISDIHRIRDVVTELRGFGRGFIVNKIGAQCSCFLPKKKTPVDLAVLIFEKMFVAVDGPQRKGFKYLALAAQYTDFRIPAISALLLQAWGLSGNTAAFGMSFGCSGFGCALAATIEAAGFALIELVRLRQPSSNFTRDAFSKGAA